MDWHGTYQPVTFHPDLFDEHPNTLRLMTYGDPLLHEVLQAVQPPMVDAAGCQVARCSLTAPWPVVGFYGVVDSSPIQSLAEIRSAVQSGQASELTDEHHHRLRAQFSAAAEQLMARETRAADSRRKALVSSLTEEVRQLLTQAAYIELAQAANRDLLDEDHLPLDFSDQAYERLKRHKFPFAGALKLVGTGLPRPRPEDPIYLKMKVTKRDLLARRLEAIRVKLGERLNQLMAAKRGADPHGTGGEPSAATPTLECFRPSQTQTGSTPDR
ncbi:MAG: hypothetical protein FJ276_37360 [Planctomycetes bacterium]|nr:hypothetical protein [Planctomycetota bacterium]